MITTLRTSGLPPFRFLIRVSGKPSLRLIIVFFDEKKERKNEKKIGSTITSIGKFKRNLAKIGFEFVDFNLNFF